MRRSDLPSDGERLAAHIERRRRGAIVEFCYRAMASRRGDSVCDTFAGRSGLIAIGPEGWREIPRERAKSLAIAGLAWDLAYGTRVMDEAEATELAGRFVSLFEATATFCTNWGEMDGTRPPFGGNWHSLTAATFNLAIAAFDERWVGLLAIEGED